MIFSNLKSVLFFLVFLFVVSFSSRAQVYVGAGYTAALFSSSGLDDAEGVVFVVQKPYLFAKSNRLEFNPALRISIFNSRAGDDFYPAMSTTVNFSPVFGYKLVQLQWLKVSPFVGPFVGWLSWYKGDVFSPEGGEYVSDSVFGLEAGFHLDVNIREKIGLRLTPYSIQLTENYYRQGSITLSFKL